jgi:hypothetical protein
VHVREFCPAGSGGIYDLSGEAGRVLRGLGDKGADAYSGVSRMGVNVAQKLALGGSMTVMPFVRSERNDQMIMSWIDIQLSSVLR